MTISYWSQMTSASFMESVRVNTKQNVINEKERIDIKMNFERRISTSNQLPTLSSFGEKSPTGQKLVPRNTQDYKMRQYWVAAAIKSRKMSTTGKPVSNEKGFSNQQQLQLSARGRDRNAFKKETKNGAGVPKGSANSTNVKDTKNTSKNENKNVKHESDDQKEEKEEINYKDDIESLDRLLDELEFDCSTPKPRKKIDKPKTEKSSNGDKLTKTSNNNDNKSKDEFDFSGDPLEKLVDDLLGGMNLKNEEPFLNSRPNDIDNEPIDLYASIGSSTSSKRKQAKPTEVANKTQPNTKQSSMMNNTESAIKQSPMTHNTESAIKQSPMTHNTESAIKQSTSANKTEYKKTESYSDKNSDSEESSDSEVSDTEESDSESSDESENESTATNKNKPLPGRVIKP